MSADHIFDSVEWHPVNNPAVADVAFNDIPFQTHEGKLQIMGFTIRCVQLNTGQRLLMSEDVEKYLLPNPLNA